MKPFSLFDEIYGWNRATDEEPGAPLGKTVSGEQDLLDITAPFSPLFDHLPSTGKAAGLVKRIESAAMLGKVLGEDRIDALKAISPATAAPSALDGVIARTCERILAKVASVAGAPLRKRAVAGIVAKFKQELIGKGHSAGVERFGPDGWERLASSMESYVAEAVAAA
jgi:hypothetical protein